MAEATKTSAPAPSKPAGPRGNRSGFKSREDYLGYLESQRSRRGENWYNQKIAEMKEREAKRREARQTAALERERVLRRERDAAWTLWREQVHAWSVGGGFDLLVAKFGEGKKVTSGRRKYDVGGVKFEIDLRKHTCARWDGNTFSNGKKGSREALGVAKCYFELEGSSDPGRDARALICELSGIKPTHVTITAEVEKRLAAVKAAAAEAEAKRIAEEEREDPLPPEKLEELPNRITDPEQIAKLTLIMAKERAFPVDYARRLVEEGTVWFGTFRYRDDDTQKVRDTGRPIVCSDIRGFETNQIVGCGARELKEFYSREEGKGKNSGYPSKGAVFIGNWGEGTKRITTTEGVYDAAALRLMRERMGKPLAADECLLVMTGQRLPEKLVKLCAKRGISITAAIDNDLSGRELIESATTVCAAHKVPFHPHLPSRGEVTFKFTDDAWGREAYIAVAKKLSEMDARFCFLPADAGWLRLVTETSDQTCALLKQTRIDEKASRPAPAKGEESVSRFGVKWHRKDWNDLIQTEYTPRATTTAGLPSADPTLEEELRVYMARRGATGSSMDILRKHLLVYPAVFDGRPSAIWTAVEPATGLVMGFRADPLNEGPAVAAGATWRVGFALGDPNKSSVMIVADTPRGAIDAWQNGGKETFTILRFDAKFPQSALDAAKKASMAVSPAFEDGESMLERQAKLAAWSRKNGLAYRAPAGVPVEVSPAASPAPTAATTPSGVHVEI